MSSASNGNSGLGQEASAGVMLWPAVLFLAGRMIDCWGLPIATDCLRGWVWQYTLGLPGDLRQQRRAEIDSDIYEQIAGDRADGYRPGEIGLRILGRALRGSPDDVSWRATCRREQQSPACARKRYFLLAAQCVEMTSSVGFAGWCLLILLLLLDVFLTEVKHAPPPGSLIIGPLIHRDLPWPWTDLVISLVLAIACKFNLAKTRAWARTLRARLLR